jgi:phosphoglycolate phosphatase-like HAD superfamily hydrolase
VLLLFDIDATLLTSARAGVLAMRDTGLDLVGPHFSEEGHSFAGSLDPIIIKAMLTAHGVASDAAAMRRFREAYHAHLRRRLEGNNTARALPGVHELLALLNAASRSHAGPPERTPILGLLTGNFEETGLLKLRCAGIDAEQFQVRAWGDDSPHDPPARDHLPPVAMQRFRDRFGREIDPRLDPIAGGITIIGDTPFDVACGLAHGCRVLGVGTGQFTTVELRAAGAHHAVESLADVDAVGRWLLGR